MCKVFWNLKFEIDFVLKSTFIVQIKKEKEYENYIRIQNPLIKVLIVVFIVKQFQ
jgi:hypothetical protein